MNVSYKKLWKLLIDRDLKKKDLEQMAFWDVYAKLSIAHWMISWSSSMSNPDGLIMIFLKNTDGGIIHG